MELNSKKTQKLKRFDDFRMLLIVMSITTSIGLSTYSGINLWGTLMYFVSSIIFWTFGHLIGSNPLFRHHEIAMKITAWVLVLLVTSSTIAKFALKVTILNLAAKIPIAIVTSVLTLAMYYWFGELVPSELRRKYMRLALIMPILFLGGYFAF